MAELLGEDCLYQIFSFMAKSDLLLYAIPVCTTWAHNSLSPHVWQDYDWSTQRIPFIVQFARKYGPYMKCLNLKDCHLVTSNVLQECLKNIYQLDELILAGCDSLQAIGLVPDKNFTGDVLSGDIFTNLKSFSVADTSIAIVDVQNILFLCSESLEVLDLSGYSFKFNQLFSRKRSRTEIEDVSLHKLHTLKLRNYSKKLASNEINKMGSKWFPNITCISVRDSTIHKYGIVEILYHLDQFKSIQRLEMKNITWGDNIGNTREPSFNFGTFSKSVPTTVTHIILHNLLREHLKPHYIEALVRKCNSLISLEFSYNCWTRNYSDSIISAILLHSPPSLQHLILAPWYRGYYYYYDYPPATLSDEQTEEEQYRKQLLDVKSPQFQFQLKTIRLEKYLFSPHMADYLQQLFCIHHDMW